MNDDDVDVELRRAIRAEGYRPPLILGPDALRARLEADSARRRTRIRRATTAAAIIAAVAVVAVVSLSQLPRSPSVGPASSTDHCDVSTVVEHGSWWKEIGGPNAFFNAEPDAFHAEPNNWLIITRFDPDAAPDQPVQIWADHLGSDDRIPGSYNSPMDPANIFHSSDPALQLPGGWYLFEQRFPVPGCWQLSAAIDGRVVGTATLTVRVGTSARVPVGTYMTTRAIPGEPCFAFENSSATYANVTAVRAWWWGQGESGDCQTRTSDVVSSMANIEPRPDSGYDLILRIPLKTGATDEIRVALQISGGSLAGVALSSDNTSVFFMSVPAVEPEFAPRQ
jgi:hypothetical protein